MKYFTKYLPVEGEIKEGDIANFPPFGFGTVIKDFSPQDGEVVLNFHIPRKDGVGSFISPISRNLNDKRPWKQFLCSRDIQQWDKDLIIDGAPFKSTLPVLDNTDIKAMEAYGAYKVIGEVSPEAIWVKEGMEFDEDEWSLFAYVIDDYLDGILKNPEYQKGYRKMYKRFVCKIKCSQCNTFH